jgi:hypothetical protein
MEIASYDRLSDVERLGDAWDRLNQTARFFVRSFRDLQDTLQNSGCRFRMMTAARDGTIVAMACFIYRDAVKRYQVANRKLFDLPIREVTLFGSTVLGEADEDVVRRFFEPVLDEAGFDWINLGDILVDSALHNVVGKLHGGVMIRRVTRKRSLRWLIPLPSSFDEYMKSLRPSTQKAVTRDGRLFEKAHPDLKVMHQPAEVEGFLRDGEKISRITYQWNVGAQLRNDESNRQKFTRLAERGQFRGYLAYSDGEPFAFAWVEMNRHGVCFYHTPGFDPRYRKLSPGTALLMQAIRDLIENTDCKLFDLATTEDERGYKSRFGTVCLDSVWLQLVRWRRPYALLIAGLDESLNVAKNLASRLVGYDRRGK